MPDVVTDAIESLRTAVKTVPAVKKKTLHLHSQDQVLDHETKLGLPAVAVLYTSMRGKPDSSKTGAATTLTCDILLVGGELCEDLSGDENITAITIMNDIRKAVLYKNMEMVGAHRKWMFVYEVPIDFEKHIAYVQRWQTTVVLNK